MDSKTTHVLVGTVLCMVVGMCAGCKDEEEETPTYRVDRLAEVVPGGAIQWMVGVDDAAALRDAVNESARWQRLFDTAMWHDIMLLPGLVSLRRAAAAVSHLENIPLGQVLVDEMLDGPALVAVQEPSRAGRDRAFLVVKHLDLSQRNVASALHAWLAGGEEVEVSEPERITYRRLKQGALTLCYFQTGDLVVFSNDEGLITVAAGLASGVRPESDSIRARGWLPSFGSGVTLVADFEALGERAPEWGVVAESLGVRGLGVTVPLEGDRVDVVWVPASRSNTAGTHELAGRRYVPQGALAYVGIASTGVRTFLEHARARWSRELGRELDLSSVAAIAAGLEGEAFYALLGLSTDPSRVGVSQVFGFRLQADSEVGEPVRTLWNQAFRGPVRETVLEQDGGARLVCAGGAADPFCFALHRDYLLVGPEGALRQALEVASGRSAGIVDRLASATGRHEGAQVVSVAIDLEGLSRALVAHLASMCDDEEMTTAQVHEVLEPFFGALGALGGYGGELWSTERGRASGRLLRLRGTAI